MKRIALTKQEVEVKVERALENACAYHSLKNWKLAFWNYVEAMTYMDLLEDMGVDYDDDCIINAHVHAMIEILEDDTIFTVDAMQKP